MPSQRAIREKSLLSIFSSYSSESITPSSNEHWNLILEPEDKIIRKLSVKALKHQLRSFPKWSQDFSDCVVLFLPLFKTYELKEATKVLSSLSKDCNQMAEILITLQKDPPAETLNSFYSLAKNVHRGAASLFKTVEDGHITHPQLATLEKVLRQLRDLSKRADFVCSPLSHREEKSIVALVKAAEERVLLKNAVQELALEAIKCKASLEVEIDSHLVHFSTDNIGKAERSILLLGAYELSQKTTPKPVIINEALELTKKYANDGAVPLVNGVLDKL